MFNPLFNNDLVSKVNYSEYPYNSALIAIYGFTYCFYKIMIFFIIFIIKI